MKKLALTLFALFAVGVSASPAFAAGSTMKIVESADSANGKINTNIPVMTFPPLTAGDGTTAPLVDFSAGAAQSRALQATTTLVSINCTVRCCVKLETGASSVTISDWPIGVDNPWSVGVQPGQSYKVSVIACP